MRIENWLIFLSWFFRLFLEDRQQDLQWRNPFRNMFRAKFYLVSNDWLLRFIQTRRIFFKGCGLFGTHQELLLPLLFPFPLSFRTWKGYSSRSAPYSPLSPLLTGLFQFDREDGLLFIWKTQLFSMKYVKALWADFFHTWMNHVKTHENPSPRSK